MRTVAAVVFIALSAVLLAWMKLGARREFPTDGVHAPRSINNNRGDRR